jgi:uncharacterized membrane protein
MRNGMGSWPFVFGAWVFLAAWMLVNEGSGFDPYPFILLDLVLSRLAAIRGQSCSSLTKRSDQMTAEQALHCYQTDTHALQMITDMKLTLDDVTEMVAVLQRAGCGLRPATVRIARPGPGGGW